VELELLSSDLCFILKSNVSGEKVIVGHAAASILENIKKRLQIFYPGRHRLEVYAGAGDFSLKLQIKLTPCTPYRNNQSDKSLGYEHS
jgi:hypothetical protein